jgi:hypothetical protein
VITEVGHTTEAADDEIKRTGAITKIPCKCFEERYTLEKWLQNKVNKKALEDYQVKLNSRSLDGLPGLRVARKMGGEWVVGHELRAHLQKLFWHPEAILLGIVFSFLILMVRPFIWIYVHHWVLLLHLSK